MQIYTNGGMEKYIGYINALEYYTAAEMNELHLSTTQMNPQIYREVKKVSNILYEVYIKFKTYPCIG